MVMHQILLNSCARAASAAETRFRIDVPIKGLRAARVVALDDGAAAVVRRVAREHWGGARFFTYDGPRADAGSSGDAAADMYLRAIDGSQSRLSDELAGSDVTMMVATADDGAKAAATIGKACTVRGIMTAGLVLGDRGEVGAAVSALRPHARVLMVTRDEEDVFEVLTALRA